MDNKLVVKAVTDEEQVGMILYYFLMEPILQHVRLMSHLHKPERAQEKRNGQG